MIISREHVDQPGYTSQWHAMTRHLLAVQRSSESLGSLTVVDHVVQTGTARVRRTRLGCCCRFSPTPTLLVWPPLHCPSPIETGWLWKLWRHCARWMWSPHVATSACQLYRTTITTRFGYAVGFRWREQDQTGQTEKLSLALRFPSFTPCFSDPFEGRGCQLRVRQNVPRVDSRE